MKCGSVNMVLNKEECLWFCPHCWREVFAPRTFYNAMKLQAKGYKDKNKFVKDYDKSVQAIVARAWDKANLKPTKGEA